jgi:maleate cis-trans isomerase
MYINPDASQGVVVATIGVLYPSSSAEDDYDRLAERLGDVRVELVRTVIAEDAHREDALREIGSATRLLEGVDALRGRDLSVLMWACTSGSFVFGLDGARQQAQLLEQATGTPASSTSLAFLAALEALAVQRVAVAASYPPDVTAMFTGLLADAGFEVVSDASLDILTAEEVASVGPERVVELVTAADVPAAEAILVPDTALHTIECVEQLEAAVGKPVLTANAVTGWYALKLAGVDAVRPGLGSLFSSDAAAGEAGR